MNDYYGAILLRIAGRWTRRGARHSRQVRVIARRLGFHNIDKLTKTGGTK